MEPASTTATPQANQNDIIPQRENEREALTIRLTPKIYTALEQWQKETGMNKNAIVISALEQLLRDKGMFATTQG